MGRRISIIVALTISLVAGAQTWNWWPTGISNERTGGDTLQYAVQIHGVASSGAFAPYWLQTNRHGDVAASAYSGNLSAGILKEASRPDRWWDYDFGVTLTGRLQSKMPAGSPYETKIGTGYTNLAYAHVRLYIVDVTVGIKPMIYETTDTLLSSGSLLWSGNAHPMPRVTVGIERWTPVPGLYGYLEIKGGVTHAWMADNVYVRKAKIHHAYAGVQAGGKLPVNIAYEIHHAAQWGGYSPDYGDLGNSWHALIDAALARAGGNNENDLYNAYGNHIVSQQLSLTAKGKGWRATAYWQNISEDNLEFIGMGQNVEDGLWGVSVKQEIWPYISGVTYEIVNTTSGSGPWHDRDGLCYAGKDEYYQNGVYKNGWNYLYRTIGTGFISSPLYNNGQQIYTGNSRIRAHHIGLRGDIDGYKWRTMVSYVRNYGNDYTKHDVLSTNTAWLVEVSKHVDKAWGLDFSISLAGDIGSQWGNTIGGMISIRKQGIITAW